MPTAKDYYSYRSEEYAAIRKAARGVTAAYGAQNKWLDTIQEWIFIETGMKHVSDIIHGIAHRALQNLDEFSDILHERHLMTEYPATEELDEDFQSMGQVFETVIDILDNTAAALNTFHEQTDKGLLKPMALRVEDLMMKNSAEYTAVLQLWQMWDSGVSNSSFDNWALRMKEGGVG